MEINYYLVTKKEKLPYIKSACFSEMRYCKEDIKKDSLYILYRPLLDGITSDVAIKYLQYIAKLPFFMCNSLPEEILKTGARVFTDIPFENILATLSAVRYLYERHSVVHNFIHLREKEHLSLQAAFFYAHFLNGRHGVEFKPETGHSIFDTYDVAYTTLPYKYNYAFVKNLQSGSKWNVSGKSYANNMWDLYTKYRETKIDAASLTYKKLLEMARKNNGIILNT